MATRHQQRACIGYCRVYDVECAHAIGIGEDGLTDCNRYDEPCVGLIVPGVLARATEEG